MALSSGFFNSINGDRKYNAEEMTAIFDGLITDGVFDNVGDLFATVPGTGRQVIVKPGKAWFNSTWTINDSMLPLDLTPPDVTLKRYDAVVIEVNKTEDVRLNEIKIVTGIPASTPAKPVLINEEDIHQHAIAYILVEPGITTISASKIENVVGQAECPFVTGILESVSIDSLFSQWEGMFEEWFENVQSQLEGDVATNLQNQINQRVRYTDRASIEDAKNGTSEYSFITPKTVGVGAESALMKIGDLKPTTRTTVGDGYLLANGSIVPNAEEDYQEALNFFIQNDGVKSTDSPYEGFVNNTTGTPYKTIIKIVKAEEKYLFLLNSGTKQKNVDTNSVRFAILDEFPGHNVNELDKVITTKITEEAFEFSGSLLDDIALYYHQGYLVCFFGILNSSRTGRKIFYKKFSDLEDGLVWNEWTIQTSDGSYLQEIDTLKLVNNKWFLFTAYGDNTYYADTINGVFYPLKKFVSQTLYTGTARIVDITYGDGTWVAVPLNVNAIFCSENLLGDWTGYEGAPWSTSNSNGALNSVKLAYSEMYNRFYLVYKTTTAGTWVMMITTDPRSTWTKNTLPSGMSECLGIWFVDYGPSTKYVVVMGTSISNYKYITIFQKTYGSDVFTGSLTSAAGVFPFAVWHDSEKLIVGGSDSTSSSSKAFWKVYMKYYKIPSISTTGVRWFMKVKDD